MREMKSTLPANSPLFALGLLAVVIDVYVFSYLNQKPNALSFAHIVSFLATAIFIYLSTLLQPKLVCNSKSFKSSQFIFVTTLLIFLRGGLLSTLTQVVNMPTLAAIVITALFSVATLYATYTLAQTLQNVPSEAKTNTLCLTAVAYIVLLKLLYLGVPELIFEEAYYWNYAQHLDIGYLDHPLIVAWTIKLFTLIFGNTEFGVRFGAFLYWFITAFFGFKLAAEVFNKTVAYRALLLIAALPAYFSFGWFMTPDAPLTACWAATIYYSYQVFIKNDSAAWLKLGVALGLGMSSKYTIALLGVAIVLYMLFNKSVCKWLARREPYLALLVALLLFSPVIIWNIQHDFLSFTFQSQGRVAQGRHFSLPRLISNLLITLTPIGLASVAALVMRRKALLDSAQAAAHDAGTLNRSYFLLMWLGLFPIAVYTFLSLSRESKLNWTGPCWLGLMPFFAFVLTQENTSKLLAWCKRAWPKTIVVLMLIYGAGMHYLGLGLPGVKFPQNTHLMGFAGLGQEVELIKTQLEKSTGEPVLVVGMDRNKIASGLAFYRTNSGNAAFNTASQHLFADNGLMYELWFAIKEQTGKTMLLVGEKPEELNSAEVLARTSSQDEIKPITAYKNGVKTGQYYTRVVHGYHAK